MTDEKQPAAVSGAPGATPGSAPAPSTAASPKPEEKVVEVYPAPDPELPEPTLRQYFVGWGTVFLGLVAIAVLLGLLMRWLR